MELDECTSLGGGDGGVRNALELGKRQVTEVAVHEPLARVALPSKAKLYHSAIRYYEKHPSLAQKDFFWAPAVCFANVSCVPSLPLCPFESAPAPAPG